MPESPSPAASADRGEATVPGAAARPAALAAGLVALLVLLGVAYACGPWRHPGNGVAAIALPGHTGRVERAVWSPDGAFLATAAEDATVRWWRRDGQLVRTLTAHTAAVRSLAWSPHGTFLATGSDDGRVLVWRSDEAAPIVPFAAGGAPISALSWSPDGRLFVAAGDRLRFYRTDTWAEATPGYPLGGAGVLAWSPDGTLLAVGAGNGSLRLFRDDASLAADLAGHTADVAGIAWSPDSARFASAGGNLRLWDARTPRLRRPLDGHGGSVLSVAWSPDGRVIASGAADRAVRLWDADGGPLATLPAHGDEVTQVAWLADGTLVSGDSGGMLRWWSAAGAPLGQERAAGCGVLHLAPAPAAPAIAVAQGCGVAEVWH